MTSRSGTSRDAEALHMWTLYKNPADYPSMYVLRAFVISGGLPEPRPLPGVFLSRDPEVLRARMIDQGLTCLPRSEHDDPVIVECWI